jgi:hypothetical protein
MHMNIYRCARPISKEAGMLPAKVTHKTFGDGAVMAFANGIAKVKFRRKGPDGKFIRSVSVEYLTGEVMNLTLPAPSVAYGPRRSPDKTAAERAFRDFYIGIIYHDSKLCIRGFHGLLTIGRKACHGLTMPYEPVVQALRRRPGARRWRLVRLSQDAYDRTVDYIVECMTFPGKNDHRYIGQAHPQPVHQRHPLGDHKEAGRKAGGRTLQRCLPGPSAERGGTAGANPKGATKGSRAPVPPVPEDVLVVPK